MTWLLIGVLLPMGDLFMPRIRPGPVDPPPPKHFQDPWWGRDKVWHFAVSHTLSNTLSSQTSFSCSASAGLTVGLGLVKELVDWKIRRTFFSWKDLFYDTLGAVLGCIRP